jgi:hypothetical protein
MCFSFPASFITAGLTGAIGLVSLTRVDGWRELPSRSAETIMISHV